MTPDDRFIQRARFDAAHAKRVWDGSAATDDAPDWYGRVATLIRAAAAPATEDEFAGESDVVARMEAAMLEPAADDELAGETEIVARMQATILGLGSEAADEADDADRPRHLRPAVPWAVRHRQGVRVVRRLVAVKAAAVTTVVAIGVTAAAATTGFVATVVVPALSKNEPKVDVEVKDLPPGTSGSSADGGTAGQGGRGGTADDPPVSMDPDEPLTCMIDLDCLIHEVEVAAGMVPASVTPTTVPASPATTPTTEPAPPTTTPTTEPAPTPTTTPTTEPAPPPTTTPTTEPPPTTTTTEAPPPEQAAPPQGEIAGPPLEAAPLSASLPDAGDTRSSVDTQAADLGDVAQPQPAG